MGKVIKILNNRSLRRLNWNKFKLIPEKSLLKMFTGEEASLSRKVRLVEKLGTSGLPPFPIIKSILVRLNDELVKFTNEKEENQVRNLKLIQEIHSMHRSVLAEMIQSDKTMKQLERKIKRKSPDLEMDVKIAKAKQSFDIGLRKFRAFIADWNDSKVMVRIELGYAIEPTH